MGAGPRQIDEILAQVVQLEPEERLRLVQRVIETLVSPGRSRPGQPLVYGEFRGPRMSTEEDFKLAEWYPSRWESDANDR